MPGPARDGGPAREFLAPRGPIDQPAGRVARPPHAELIGPAVPVPVVPPGEQPAGDVPGAVGHPVPEPERDGVAVSQGGEPGVDPPSREVDRPVRPAVGAERIAPGPLQEVGDARLVEGVSVVHAIDRPGAGELVEPPVGGGAQGQDGLRRRAGRLAVLDPIAPGDDLQQVQRRLDDLRLGLDLKPGRPRGPRVISAQQVLLRGGDVAVPAVGQLDDHGPLQGALELDLQAGQGVGLRRRGRDGQLADPDRLDDDLGRLPLVQDQLLPGVDLRGVLRRPVAHRLDDPPGPRQPLGVRHPIAQGEPRLGHLQVGVGPELGRFVGADGEIDERVGIGLDRQVLPPRPRGLRVVDPVDVPAAAVGHDADEGRPLPLTLGLSGDPGLQALAEEAEVVGAQGLVAEVVHREVRQDGHRAAVGRSQGDQREVRVLGAGLAGHVVPVAGGVHVGPEGRVAEGVVGQAVGPPDPAPERRVLAGIGDAPADLGRLQVPRRLGDGLDELRSKEWHVGRVGLGAEAGHARGGAVGVRGRDQDPIGRDPGPGAGGGLRLVEQRPGHHAAVDDDDGEPVLAVVQHQRPGAEGRLHRVRHPAEHPPVHQDRQLFGSHVDRRGPGRKPRPGGRAGHRGQNHNRDDERVSHRNPLRPRSTSGDPGRPGL